MELIHRSETPYLALKLKRVKDRDFETYDSNEVKKEPQEEAKTDDEMPEEEEEEVEEAPVPFGTHVNSILHSNFSNMEVYINNQKFSNSNGLYADKSYISNNLKGAVYENKGALHSQGNDHQDFPD